jgi:poly-gamma-glutamate synthesis protein (capsule biosynthesis protein)
MSDSKVRILAIGDIMLGNGPLCPQAGVGAAIKRTGSEKIFEHVRPILAKGDVVFGNLEAVLAENEPGDKTLTLIGSSRSVSGLKYAGFNVLSVANNHALEHGKDSLEYTAKLLESHDIKCIGNETGGNNSGGLQFMDCGDTRMAFLAYCLTGDPTANTITGNPEEIYEHIRHASLLADAVVVSMHWGDEYIQRPSVKQIETAHQMVEAGASLVLGHHPHVIQPIERYKNALIAYSLGNFVFDIGYIPQTKRSIILECQLTRGSISGYNVHPVIINKQFQPVLLDGVQKAATLKEMERLNEYALSTSEAYPANYKSELAVARKQARKAMKRYFLKNLLRYPPGFTFRIAREYLGKRLK